MAVSYVPTVRFFFLKLSGFYNLFHGDFIFVVVKILLYDAYDT